MPKAKRKSSKTNQSLENKDNESGPIKRSKYFKDTSHAKQKSQIPSHKNIPVSEASPLKPSPANETNGKPSRYLEHFFKKSCEELAKDLLGKTLVRLLGNGERLSGLIVETEAYIGGKDKGSHSYNGKRTSRNEAMFMDPGTVYVYHIYGMYTCINISSKGEGAAVLLRGLDPVDGIPSMREQRGTKRSDKGKGLKMHEMTNGPSKLTQALQIDKQTFNKKSLCSHPLIWIEDGIEVAKEDIVTCSRIGIDYAEEWSKAPLRFYLKGKKGVSIRDKSAEATLSS